MYNSRYRKEDFEKMNYPIHCLTGFVWDTFKEFDRGPFKPNEPAQYILYNKFLLYVIYLLDAGCPIQRIKNLQERKQEAIYLAGIPEDCPVVDIISYKYEPVNKMVAGFIRNEKSKEWTLLKAMEEAFYTLVDKMRQPIDTTDIGSDKEKNAYAALRQCSTDAVFLLSEMDELYKKLTDIQEIKHVIQKEIRQTGNTPIEIVLSKQK